MRCFYLRVFVLLCMAFAALPAAAEIYKWIDADGNVHYGDKPGGEDSEQMQLPTPSSGPDETRSDAERRDYQQRLLRSMSEERRQKQQADAEVQQQQQEQQRRCEQAKKILQQTRQAGTLYHENEQGERQVLDKQQRQRAEAQAEAQVKKYCE